MKSIRGAGVVPGLILGLSPVLMGALSATALAAEPQIRLAPEDITALATAQAAAPRPGPKQVVLNGDPAKDGLYTVEVTIPAHATVPPHTHRDDRAVYVLSGTLYVGYGEKRDEAQLKKLPAGSYYTEPAATAHYTETHDEPVVVLITGYGPSDTHLTGGPPAATKAPG